MMLPEDLYDNVVVSMTRFVDDFRLAMMPNAVYLNWDAHAEISELQPVDYVGLSGLGMSEDDPSQYVIVCGVTVATWGDPGNARMTKAISQLRGRLIPGTRVPVYDHGTAEEGSFMITRTPLAVLPVGRAETRPVQSLEVHLLLDPGAASSLR